MRTDCRGPGILQRPRAQPPDREANEPQDQPARPERGLARESGRREDRAATGPAKTGVVKEFRKNPRGDTDGFLLDDGTEVRFPAGAGQRLSAMVSLKDKVTIEGWTHPGETEIHAATIKHGLSGKVITVDRAPPDVAGSAERPLAEIPELRQATGLRLLFTRETTLGLREPQAHGDPPTRSRPGKAVLP